MSGIAGIFIFDDSKTNTLEDSIISMLNALVIGNKNELKYYSDNKNFALGICNCNDVNVAQILKNTASDYGVIFKGNLTNKKELEVSFSVDGVNDGHKEAQIALSLFKKYGTNAVYHLKGIFAYVIWDKHRKTLHIATDRYGYEYIYYYKDKEKVLFASEKKAILAVMDKKPSANIEAICDLYNFHTIFDLKTPFNNISLMPHAALCTISKDSVRLSRYWDYPFEVNIQKYTDAQLLNKSRQVIKSAVGDAISGQNRIGILLSGGLDSRILAAVSRSYLADIMVFSFKHSNLRLKEEIIAEKIASELGLQYHCLEAEETDVISSVENTIMETDGFWGFHDSLSYIKKIKESFPGIPIMHGYLMDTMFKSSWAFFPNKCKLLTTEEMVKRYSTMGDYVCERIFTSDFGELLKKQKRQSIVKSIKDLPIDKPAEVSLRFYCLNRGRRCIVNEVKSLDNHTQLIFPGTNYDLVDFAWKLPYELRSNTEFYRRLIREWFPNIGRIPWVRTGKSLEKGVSERRKKIERLIFKTKYAFQRATRGKIDLMNATNSFNRRFRKDNKFREAIKEILYDQKTLSRGFLSQNGIDTLFKQQLSGRDFHATFQSIITVEMLYRKFIDG